MSEGRKGINDAATALLEQHSQILELRRVVRDLIALSALPAMWKDYEPSRIADSAASALASIIGANFVYVGLPSERPPIDVVMTPAPVDAARRDLIAAAVKREIGRAGGRQAIPIANPSLGEPLRLAIAPIGLNGVGVGHRPAAQLSDPRGHRNARRRYRDDGRRGERARIGRSQRFWREDARAT
jgi:hypothetical protein